MSKKIINACWYDYPAYYDLSMREDTPAETAFLADVGEKYCDFKVKTFLEPACGTGRVLTQLAARGFQVLGYDQNEASLKYLRRRLRRRKLQDRCVIYTADMRDFTLPDGFSQVDVAYNLVNTFRCLLSEDDAVAHLRCVARALRSGGLYILALHLLPLDVDLSSTERWTQCHGNTQVTVTLRVLNASRKKRVENLRMSMLVRTGNGENRRELRLRDEFSFRMYTASEFLKMLKKVPEFELLDVYDFWYDINEPLKLDDWITDTVFVLRKK